MHRPNRFVKAAVLASSLLLVGVFVAYRANAVNSWPGLAELPDNDTTVSQDAFAANWNGSAISRRPPDIDANPFNPPRSALEEAAVLPPPINGVINGAVGEPQGIYFSSSKSAVMFVPSELTASGSGSIVMDSSKDGFVFRPAAPSSTVSGSGSAYIYSSKSGTILPPPAPAQTVTGVTIMSGSKSDRVLVPQKALTKDELIMMSGSKSLILTAPASAEVPRIQQVKKRPAPNTSQAAARSR